MRIAREDAEMYLSRLVLGDLVLCVLSAVLALAVGASCLWDVDLWKTLLASFHHAEPVLHLNVSLAGEFCRFPEEVLHLLSL